MKERRNCRDKQETETDYVKASFFSSLFDVKLMRALLYPSFNTRLPCFANFRHEIAEISRRIAQPVGNGGARSYKSSVRGISRSLPGADAYEKATTPYFLRRLENRRKSTSGDAPLVNHNFAASRHALLRCNVMDDVMRLGSMARQLGISFRLSLTSRRDFYLRPAVSESRIDLNSFSARFPSNPSRTSISGWRKIVNE